MTGKPIPEITELNRAFFAGCAQGELRLRRCPACGARFRFAHAWCPECWSPDIIWEPASGRATVTHFSVVHQAPSAAFQAGAPYVLALVDLVEGVRLMTNIVGCDPAEVHVGMAVAAIFEQRGDVYLPVFRPA
jgi:uncharacterized OB-fold protein